MKRCALILAVLLSGFPNLWTTGAQTWKDSFRVGGQLTAGTAGVGGELVVQLPRQVGFRAGYSFFPKSSYTFSFTLPEQYGGDGSKSGINAGFKMDHSYVLVDFFVSPEGGFRITEGVWFGSSDFLDIHNTTPLPDAFNSIGVDIGGYSVHAKDGDISVSMKANAVKPYIGVGIGRLRPYRRVNVTFDAGLLFTACRGLRATGYGLLDEKEVRITSYSVDMIDRELLDKLGGLMAWPVIRCNVQFRIF